MLGDLDNLYSTAVNPVDFIKDINKKMQVPHRISFGPMHGIDSMDPERPSSCSATLEADMQVPERILVAERLQTDDALPASELSDFDINPIDRRLSIPAPPPALVLDEINYPDLNRLLMEREQQSSSPLHPPPESNCPSPGGSKLLRVSTQSCQAEQMNNSAYAIVPAYSEKRLRALERRIVQLEHQHIRHKQMEHLGFAFIGIVLVYKILRSLF